MATTKVVDPEHEKAIRVDRLARTNQIVPPAYVLRLVGVDAGHMMRGIKRVTDQNRIIALSVELAVAFVSQLITVDARTAFQFDRLIELHHFRFDDTNRALRHSLPN
jgi:hypothetical protein